MTRIVDPGRSELMKRWDQYIENLEGAVGQELDDNTVKELRWAFMAGGAGALDVLREAQKHGMQAFMGAMAQIQADAQKLLAEMKGEMPKWKN